VIFPTVLFQFDPITDGYALLTTLGIVGVLVAAATIGVGYLIYSRFKRG